MPTSLTPRWLHSPAITIEDRSPTRWADVQGKRFAAAAPRRHLGASPPVPPVAGPADDTLDSRMYFYRARGNWLAIRSEALAGRASRHPPVLHSGHGYGTPRPSSENALHRARRRLAGSERAHVRAEPRRRRPACGARPALRPCRLRRARRSIDRSEEHTSEH